MLHTTAEESESTATAAGGFPSEGFAVGRVVAAAAATHDEASGASASEATTAADALTVGDVVSIGGVRSRASVASTADGEITRETDLEIADAAIGGQAVVIGPDGISLAGTALPLPQANPVGEVLAESGVTLEYLEAVETEDGVIAAGLRITVAREVPTFPEPVEVVYELGRAHAFARPGSLGLGTGSGNASVGAPAAAQPGGTQPQVTPGSGSSDISPEVPAARAAEAPATASGQAMPREASTIAEALVVDPVMFYPVLLGAGLFLLCGGTSTRLFGVRLLWSS